MNRRFSTLSLVFILGLFTCFRLQQAKINVKNIYNVATWDAFGYYMYLPSLFIYGDAKELNWVAGIDSVYAVTGGTFYQASKLESGTYTNKYLGGVALMQSPFFVLSHWYAHTYAFRTDGFSWPYQLGIICATLFWTMTGFYVLRKALLYYFDDRITSVTLLLLAFATNLIQYVSIDSGQSHCYIFALYSLVLWWTIKWHETPRTLYAFLIGLVCGVAIICRPTELIIIFIPLLWNIHPKTIAPYKWEKVRQHKTHVLIGVFGGLLGGIPQILYWQYTTGSLVYDVGSKWNFLNPWFRVLFGPEKGWFLYTPITIAMVAGCGMIKNYPFQKAVVTFCLLNIWIIISWSDWRYGGSYSTRALVQSYPVFALALAGFLKAIITKQKGWIIYPVSLGCILLNFYQLNTYNSGIGESFSPLLKLFQ